MGLKEIRLLQRAFGEKLDDLCKRPLASSNQEVELWRTNHEEYLKVKAENVAYMPTEFEDEVDDMFIQTRDTYFEFIESWYGYGMQEYQEKLLRLRVKNSEISKDESILARENINNTDFDNVDIEKKIQDFFDIFENIVYAMKNNEEWFDLYKASTIRGDGLVFNIASLDLFAWQLPKADSRDKNDYQQLAKIITIFFFIEKLYKAEESLNNDVNPFDKISMELDKIFAYYDYAKKTKVLSCKT